MQLLPQGIRREEKGEGAGSRNHKNNNHIIVFNNEKYHFRHNFWLLFEQPAHSHTPGSWNSEIPTSSKGRPHFGWSRVRARPQQPLKPA